MSEYKLVLMPGAWMPEQEEYHLLASPSIENKSEFILDDDGDSFGPCLEGIRDAGLDAFTGDLDTSPATATLVLGVGEPRLARLRRLHPTAQYRFKRINMTTSMGIVLRRHILARTASAWPHLDKVFFRETDGDGTISNYTYWWSLVPGVHWTEPGWDDPVIPGTMDIHGGRPVVKVQGNEAVAPIIELINRAVAIEKQRCAQYMDTSPQWWKRWIEALNHINDISWQMKAIPQESRQEKEEDPF